MSHDPTWSGKDFSNVKQATFWETLHLSFLCMHVPLYDLWYSFCLYDNNPFICQLCSAPGLARKIRHLILPSDPRRQNPLSIRCPSTGYPPGKWNLKKNEFDASDGYSTDFRRISSGWITGFDTQALVPTSEYLMRFPGFSTTRCSKFKAHPEASWKNWS